MYKDEDPMIEKAMEKVNILSNIHATAFTVAELQATTTSFSKEASLVSEGSLGGQTAGSWPSRNLIPKLPWWTTEMTF
jgi:hypothetical protein